MNYATIKYCDIANGTGVRTSLFVSGCRRHCPECFNAVAWDFGYGLPFDKAVRNEILGSLAPDYIDGLSLLGGEPFEPENQRALVPFLHEVRVLYPHKTIWCYTGNVYETELLQPSHARCEVTDEMLSLIDVLVDGEFIPAQHDISLRFRGSSNQRIIDLNATRAAVEEVARHLAGHGLRHGRDALGRHAVVPGHGQHQGRAHAQGRDPACHGIQAPAQFFQTPQTAARLGQVVQMGLGLLQQGAFQGTDKEARQGGHFHSLTIYGNLFHVFCVTSCPARRKHGPSLPV